MARAVVVPTGVRVIGASAVLNYDVVILDPPNEPQGLSSDFTLSGGHGKAENLPTWKNKIVADVAEKGVTITTDNIMLWGE